MHVKVLGVVNILVCAGLYAVYDSRFEVEEDRARDISCVVGLVEEDILPVSPLCCKILEVSVLVDAVLATELLPEFTADCMRALVSPLAQSQGWRTRRVLALGDLVLY
jgi:hypothetical protein